MKIILDKYIPNVYKMKDNYLMNHMNILCILFFLPQFKKYVLYFRNYCYYLIPSLTISRFINNEIYFYMYFNFIHKYYSMIHRDSLNWGYNFSFLYFLIKEAKYSLFSVPQNNTKLKARAKCKTFLSCFLLKNNYVFLFFDKIKNITGGGYEQLCCDRDVYSENII